MLTHYLWKTFIDFDFEYNNEIDSLTILEILFSSMLTIPIDIMFLPLELITYCIYKIINKSR